MNFIVLILYSIHELTGEEGHLKKVLSLNSVASLDCKHKPITNIDSNKKKTVCRRTTFLICEKFVGTIKAFACLMCTHKCQIVIYTVDENFIATIKM